MEHDSPLQTKLLKGVKRRILDTSDEGEEFTRSLEVYAVASPQPRSSTPSDKQRGKQWTETATLSISSEQSTSHGS